MPKITHDDIVTAYAELIYLEIPLGRLSPWATYEKLENGQHSIILWDGNFEVGGFTGSAREVYAYALALSHLTTAIVAGSDQVEVVEKLAMKSFRSH